jgi:hypothetical protein
LACSADVKSERNSEDQRATEQTCSSAQSEPACLRWGPKLRSGRRKEILYRDQEAVSPARNRLDKSRVLRGVAKRLPQLPNGRTQAVVEINKCIGRPQSLPQLLSRNEFAPPLKKEYEDLKRLLLYLNLDSVFA